MKLLSVVLSLVALVAALPTRDIEEEFKAINDTQISSAAARCQPGLHYCFGQIVQDLGVAQQTLLHQYCDQQYTFDPQSCNTCKRPFPLPNCYAGPGAWNSAFACKGGDSYDFAYRCDNWCEAGKCI